MKHTHQQQVQEPQLLRLVVQIREWETCQSQCLGSGSGRDLFFQLAASYLNPLSTPPYIKQLQGRHSERTLRLRLREFAQEGLIEIVSDTPDQRTRQIVPIEKFKQLLNEHLNLTRKMLDQHYIVIDKNN
jgi:hypothetical protein